MGSTPQANWFNDIVVDDDDDVDPFEVHERGLPIEIGDEEARVSAAIQKSLAKEGRFADRGVTCEIKDVPDTTCWACPVYKGNTDDPIAVLCTLGREQDRLLTRAIQLRVERKQREELEDQKRQVYDAALEEATVA